MLKRTLSLILSVALAATGCAHATTIHEPAPPPASADTLRAEFAGYVRHIPPGSRIRVERRSGRAVRGTLMMVRDDAMVVQLHTRVAEPPIEIPMDSVTRVTLDQGTSVGKAVAIAAATGAAATFGVILFLATMLRD